MCCTTCSCFCGRDLYNKTHTVSTHAHARAGVPAIVEHWLHNASMKKTQIGWGGMDRRRKEAKCKRMWCGGVVLPYVPTWGCGWGVCVVRQQRLFARVGAHARVYTCVGVLPLWRPANNKAGQQGWCYLSICICYLFIHAVASWVGELGFVFKGGWDGGVICLLPLKQTMLHHLAPAAVHAGRHTAWCVDDRLRVLLCWCLVGMRCRQSPTTIIGFKPSDLQPLHPG